MKTSYRSVSKRIRTASHRRTALLLAVAFIAFVLFQTPISAFVEASLKTQRPLSPVKAQPNLNTISESARIQIMALADEKKSRTPAQRKIGSQLLYALKKEKGETVRGSESLRNSINITNDKRVLVDIRLLTEKPIGTVKMMEKQGFLQSVDIVSAVGNTIRARVDLTSIEQIAAIPEVRSVRPAARSITSRATASFEASPANVNPALRSSLRPGFDLRAARLRSQLSSALLANRASRASLMALNVSEGDITHRALEARNFFGHDGTGVRIGVMSDGVDSLAGLQGTGDLPAGVTVLPGQAGSGDEGSAMLEIVHDLAPGAELFFATAATSITSFAQNILDLRTAGCDIIVDDIIYFAESPFQDGQAPSVISPTNGGLILEAVKTVTADGALYFSSAGNEGNLNDGTSGTWEGDFNANGTLDPVLTGAGLVHDFGDGGQSNLVTASSAVVTLHWSDPLGASANDYDVYILNGALTTIFDASTDVQDGDDDPFEITGTAFTGERIVVAQFSGADRYIRVENFRGELTLATSGGTYGHSTAAAAFGVAAVDVATALPGPFVGGATNPVETFSCDGPRRFLYNADSSEITPGNVSSTGGLLRQKPDIAAADGVACAAPGFNPFFGTSAAAPHAAAIAGLLLSFNPALTPAQVRTALTSSALDIEAAGVDRDSGAGIVMAFQALEAAGATPMANPMLGTVTPTGVVHDGDGGIEPCETFSLSIQVLNPGGAAATAVSAVLATSTPGVTITTPNSAYPDIPSGGSAVNTTPFVFSVAESVPCGTTLDFTLTVSFTGGTSPKVLAFSLPTGSPVAPVTVSYVGPAVPIADSPGEDVPGTTAVANLTVAGITGLVSDLDFRFDGSACSAAIGSTTVGLDHTFVNDLLITLTSPSGNVVTIINRTDLSGNNFCQTLLDDESAGGPIQAVASSSAPFTGSFTPANPLSAFDGEDPNGVWILSVTDNFVGDVGNIRAFSLIISGSSCDAPCCTITCPANVTVSNDPNQCGAVVTYPPPTSEGCGTVTCSPASGSFFPVGTTTVSCSATGGSCTFTVTVNDTQPPTITCPTSVFAMASGPCSVVTFATPTGSDNCPGVTVACVPPSGSCLPVGTTSVTCTATDVAGNTATCTFAVQMFDSCLQDDTNPASVLLFNSQTGAYMFCCGTTKLSGTGKITKKGLIVTLEHSAADRRVLGKLDGSAKSGSASLQTPPGKTICTITDRSTLNNTCVCN
jgi:subtilisin-like proprotein convertase family protein